MNEDEGWFKVKEQLTFEEGKKIRWGLAKDDVTPQDIFRLTNGSAKDRAIIAKYCFQDCNLVQHIFRKNDIWTGFIEIANVCSVPIEYIVMRGQGIKLLSFLAKECRKKNTLMPVLEKAENDGSYEGAIVFPPMCGLYLDNPVAVVDYSSLYPSSMISENISHDSKVWTKEYDLSGRLIKETGNVEYDNLPEYKYVDVTYDTYEWKRQSEKKKEEKIKVGYKVCRFAQFPEGRKAILPEILTELLGARKATRKKAKYKTVKDRYGTYVGLLKKTETHHIITTEKQGIIEVENDDVLSVEDTYDDYMKNVFDKRQLGIKVTANSMYGQTGARTSAFYEKDIAASTTATGRKLLIYGKKIIKEVYGDRICETKYGKVRSKAEVVYGDTDSCFMCFNLEDLEGNKIRGQRALEITIELAIEAGEIATKFLKSPHDLEYEKTFMPFCLLSKKRYVSMLYEM
jgi:DNA polymerase elongation subunit (family B)